MRSAAAGGTSQFLVKLQIERIDEDHLIEHLDRLRGRLLVSLAEVNLAERQAGAKILRRDLTPLLQALDHLPFITALHVMRDQARVDVGPPLQGSRAWRDFPGPLEVFNGFFLLALFESDISKRLVGPEAVACLALQGLEEILPARGRLTFPQILQTENRKGICIVRIEFQHLPDGEMHINLDPAAVIDPGQLEKLLDVPRIILEIKLQLISQALLHHKGNQAVGLNPVVEIFEEPLVKLLKLQLEDLAKNLPSRLVLLIPIENIENLFEAPALGDVTNDHAALVVGHQNLHRVLGF